MTPDQRAAVVAEAETWLGTPWRHMQRLKGVGVDCANLPAAVYEACGLIQHVEADYPRQWMLHRRENRFIDWIIRVGGVEITADQMQPGDLVLWKYGLCFSHSGFFVGNDRVIHAYIDARAVAYGNLARDTDLREREKRYFTIGAPA